MHRWARALVGVLLIGLVGAGCASVSTDADEVAIAYSGGPIQGTHYKDTFGPGSGLKWLGMNDTSYSYPTTTRNYIISKNANEGDRAGEDFVRATTYDRIEVDWEVAVFFKLNTAKMRSFHENVGLKFHAWNGGDCPDADMDGWDCMLDQTFRPQLENAIQRESRLVSSDEIAAGVISATTGNPDVKPLTENESVIDRIQSGIAENLKTNINRVVGEEYFCGPEHQYAGPDHGRIPKNNCPDLKVVLKRPTLPNGVMKAYEAQRTSVLGIQTARNDAEQARERAKGQQESSNAAQALTPEYLRLLEIQAYQECAKHGNCTLVVTPGGTNVNVTPR